MRRILGKIANFFERYGDNFVTAAGIWFILCFIGMFFEKRFPFLHPFVYWTFWIWAGLFVAGITGLTIIAPGVTLAKELESCFLEQRASKIERILTRLWCTGAGLLFTSLLGAAYVLQATGIVTDIKIWFIAFCFLILLIPYCFAGFYVRRAIRNAKKAD